MFFWFYSVACFCGSTMLRASSTGAGLGLGMIIAPPRQPSWIRLIIRVRESRCEAAWSCEGLRRRLGVMSYLTAPMTTRAERVTASNSKKEMKRIESAYKVSSIYGLCNGM